ncbi:sugar ABC transporter ATP-binding protein [Bauldia sp.]|uniref:sugar ABC transporter ATP-binding protein n=1 Tax=Bauldia sp. TaxID=2575872 RepID=UPI003BAB53D5
MADAFLELDSITKTYPGVRALDSVSLSVAPGEVVGLIGENGAGKSTLMKVLGGVTAPTLGTIRIDGVERDAMTVSEAIDAGIAFVHQELNLFENLDVAANIFIGREPRQGPLRLVDRKKLRESVAPLLDRLEVDFGPDTMVSELSIAQRQLLEIVKALSMESRVVIMDEPTSSLTISETERLLKVVADLKADGVSVIFVTHRLNELHACADRVVVLRDGRLAGNLAKDEISHAAMIRLMIGRDLKSLYVPPAAPPGDTLFSITDARTEAYPHHPVSLSVRKGEILGLAGLVGSGRTELARAVFGIDALLAGAVDLAGERLAIATPSDAIGRGLYLVPEDRKQHGAVLEFSITANISLPQLRPLSRRGVIDRRQERDIAETQRRKLNVRTPNVAAEVGSLSGGNQQKVVLARWLSMKPRAIIFDEPTRGIDVGAKQEIYDMLRGLADAGVAILMISSDMEEVIGVSDRIAVMCEGRVSGILDRPDFSEENVLKLAVGHASH